MRNPIKFYWKDLHHLYIGLGVVVFARSMAPYEYLNLWANIFFVLGAYIVVDDIVEHSITGNTPLRLFDEKILQPSMKKAKDLFKNKSRRN